MWNTTHINLYIKIMWHTCIHTSGLNTQEWILYLKKSTRIGLYFFLKYDYFVLHFIKNLIVCLFIVTIYKYYLISRGKILHMLCAIEFLPPSDKFRTTLAESVTPRDMFCNLLPWFPPWLTSLISPLPRCINSIQFNYFVGITVQVQSYQGT